MKEDRESAIANSKAAASHLWTLLRRGEEESREGDQRMRVFSLGILLTISNASTYLGMDTLKTDVPPTRTSI